MTLREFLSHRLGPMVGGLCCFVVAALFLLATGTRPGVVALLTLGFLLIFVGRYTVEFLRLRAQLSELEAILEGLEKKYLLMECIPTPKDIYQRKLFQLTRRAGKSMLEAVSQAQAAQRAYRDYIEEWVHEIKTPITAAQLLCRDLEGDKRRKLTQELAQVEAHVERALFYARAESPERDCVIRQNVLEAIVSQAIQTHRSLLIQNGVRVETQGLDCTVYTDEKWTAFILGQLLQNAARYRGETPVIHITARPLGQKVALTVADNGLGIPAHELPRVCERGFTGSNGRNRGGSTGMGLYLCRKLAAFLSLDLQITSQEGEGTQVTLTFPATAGAEE